MPAAPAEAALAPTNAIDALLDAITSLKAQQKQLEQQLEPLLEALNTAMAAGQLDPPFSHNDWAFAHSPGRLTHAFPQEVQQIEQQLCWIFRFVGRCILICRLLGGLFSFILLQCLC